MTHDHLEPYLACRCSTNRSGNTMASPAERIFAHCRAHSTSDYFIYISQQSWDTFEAMAHDHLEPYLACRCFTDRSGNTMASHDERIFAHCWAHETFDYSLYISKQSWDTFDAMAHAHLEPYIACWCNTDRSGNTMASHAERIAAHC